MGEPSSLKRVDHVQSLRAEVEGMISTAIISGELEPGTLVSVPSLAAQFAVSATPVREAMLDLQKRGFVSPVKNKGFRVTTVSDDDIREITQLRVWLEAPAMRSIAGSFPRDEISRFRALADLTVRAVDSGELSGFIEADSAFHHELLALEGNKRLLEIIATLREQTRMVGLASMVGTPELRRSASEHHRILDLLMDGDGEGVDELVRAHIGEHARWGTTHA